jgi:hypothetical protein
MQQGAGYAFVIGVLSNGQGWTALHCRGLSQPSRVPSSTGSKRPATSDQGHEPKHQENHEADLRESGSQTCNTPKSENSR